MKPAGFKQFLIATFCAQSLAGFLGFRAALAAPPIETGDEKVFDLARQRMVEEQIKGRGISDPDVLSALFKVKRHLFVETGFERSAYNDTPLSIGYGQTISQPYIVAYMTEVLRLGPEDRVLEIGTGSGYQAAVLGEIVREVTTIEIVKPLAERAAKRMADLGYHNVTVRHGDGYEGWPERAPYDAVIVTAAPGEIPEHLLEQMKIGARMVIPLGSFSQELYLITKTKDGIQKKKLFPVRFVPMVAEAA